MRKLRKEESQKVEEERRSQKLGLGDVQSSTARVHEWVNNSEKNRSIRSRSNIQRKITKTQVQGLQGKENEDPPDENSSNEINISQAKEGANHQKLKCKYRKEYGVDAYKYKHHKLLHNENLAGERSRENENVYIINNETSISRQSEEKAVMTVQLARRNVLLRMIPVKS
ncbi:hypothetical protein JTB14_020633 [Gonioctena quinquepunctata]|nr:hypothetical protein JTB14_020633 [Gonioctena quinquepunctata]